MDSKMLIALIGKTSLHGFDNQSFHRNKDIYFYHFLVQFNCIILLMN